MIPYLMETDQDCGPRALRSMTGLPWETIASRWPGGWRESGFGRSGAPNDSPWDHLALLESLGIKYRVVTYPMILAGVCQPEKTAILVHFEAPTSGPRSILSRMKAWAWPTLHQHWVILREVTTTTVSVWWGGSGPDQSRTYSHADFARAYRAGFPNCAYEIGRGDGRLTYSQRLVATMTGRFA